MPSGTETSVSMRVFKRRWVRCVPPRWPFVWRGLVPLVGLLALALYATVPFARIDMQASVQAYTRAALDAQGFGWVQLEVSGQDVRLSGAQPAMGAGESAVAIAQAATCPSWVGWLRCAVRVDGQFTLPAVPAAPATGPQAGGPER